MATLLTDSLISFWPLDESSGNALDVIGTNELTAVNAPGSSAMAAPDGGTARDLELSSTQYFSIADNADLSMVGDIDWTVAIWVQLESKGANHTPLGKWDFGAGEREYAVRFDDAADRFVGFTSTNGSNQTDVVADSLGSPSLGQWYLVILWKDAARLNIQVDNGPIDSDSIGSYSIHDGVSEFNIGSLNAGTTSWDGLLWACGLWKRVLSPVERELLWNRGNGLKDPTNPPVVAPNTLVDEDFSEDAGGFTNATQSASEGSDFDPGRLEIAAGNTAVRTFTTSTAQHVYSEWWFNPQSVDVTSDDSKDTVFMLLPSGGSVEESNSLATLRAVHNSNDGASADRLAISYLDGVSEVLLHDTFGDILFPWSTWLKFSVDVNLDAGTYDLYVNDVLWQTDIDSPNASATDAERFAVAHGASAANSVLLDNVQVIENWSNSDDDQTLVDHDFTSEVGEIETLTPQTSTRNLHSQPWKVAIDDTTIGAFTADGSNGLEPDADIVRGAFQRCAANGVCEMEFSTSVADDVYMGIALRRFNTLLPAEGYLVRYYDQANRYQLLHNGNVIGQAGSPTLLLGTVYTLKVEVRGLYFTLSYALGGIDVGGYTELFTVRLDHAGSSLLSEENWGPLINDVAGIGTDNYIRRFRFTGPVEEPETTIVLDDKTWVLTAGQAREFYASDVDLSERNLFWSKGQQPGHLGGSDMNNSVVAHKAMIDTPDVKVFRQRGLNIRSRAITGVADIWWTFTRRGVWISDGVLVLNPSASNNLSPDFDLNPDYWSTDFLLIGPTGSASELSDLPFHDWLVRVNDALLPEGLQSITDFGGEEVRVTEVTRPITNTFDAAHDLQTLNRGLGGTLGRMVGERDPQHLDDGTEYRYGRFFLFESGTLSLDSATIEAMRDDIVSPLTFDFNSGSLNTSSPGDDDNDGFNERYGWWEIDTSTSGIVSWTIRPESISRHSLQFRIHGTNDVSPVFINKAEATEDVDYTLTQLADEEWLLQLTGTVDEDTQIDLSAVLSIARIRVDIELVGDA